MLTVDVECKRRERRFKSPGSAVRDSCPSAGRDVSVITNRREGCFCYYVVSVISFCRVGPESKERFGQGPDPDLAGKVWFLNFFGHLGPVGRPMEGYVDFDHTNFSRQSHPRHPDYFPAGLDAEILTFWG